MQLLTAEIFFLLVYVIENIQTELSPDGDNVCLKLETFEEINYVKIKKPKTLSRKVWCWSPKQLFRCVDYFTVWNEITEPRTSIKTRKVPKCCDGYKEEKIYNYDKYRPSTVCLPVCLKGCIRGECVAPEICDCFSGYYGSECTKVCSDGYWGKNCRNTCDCSNDEKCDKITGVCDCEKGWMGDRCDLPCEPGYHGYKCEMKCDCGGSSCNHQTGECFTTTTTTTTTTEFDVTETSPETHQTNETSNKDFTIEILKTTERVSENDSSLTETTAIDVVNTSVLTTDRKLSGTTLPEMSSVTTTVGDSTFETTTIDIQEEIIVTKKINENLNELNSATQINFSGSETEVEETNSDKIIKDSEGNNKTMIKILHFLPGLSVFSSVSIVSFIIAAFWLINKHRKRTKLVLATPDNKKQVFQQEEQNKNSGENFYWSATCTNNPVYLSDVDINRTIPVLETFKPVNMSYLITENEPSKQ